MQSTNWRHAWLIFDGFMAFIGHLEKKTAVSIKTPGQTMWQDTWSSTLGSFKTMIFFWHNPQWLKSWVWRIHSSFELWCWWLVHSLLKVKEETGVLKQTAWNNFRNDLMIFTLFLAGGGWAKNDSALVLSGLWMSHECHELPICHQCHVMAFCGNKKGNIDTPQTMQDVRNGRHERKSQSFGTFVWCLQTVQIWEVKLSWFHSLQEQKQKAGKEGQPGFCTVLACMTNVFPSMSSHRSLLEEDCMLKIDFLLFDGYWHCIKKQEMNWIKGNDFWKKLTLVSEMLHVDFKRTRQWCAIGKWHFPVKDAWKWLQNGFSFVPMCQLVCNQPSFCRWWCHIFLLSTASVAEHLDFSSSFFQHWILKKQGGVDGSLLLKCLLKMNQAGMSRQGLLLNHWLHSFQTPQQCLLQF